MSRQNADYGYDIQKVYLEMMLTDAETFVRCQSVFNDSAFDRRLQPAAKFIKEYVVEHNAMPTFDMVNASTESNLKHPGDLAENHYDWLLQDFETFSRHKALEAAILKSADLLEKGEYGPVEDLVKNAVQIGLQKDLGTDYWKDPKARLEAIKDKYVSEELRNLAMELNTIFVTASQLNRSSVEEIEFDHSHISGGISKINTADNLVGIFTSRAMRERGRYQIQLMKTRSSSGVGQKIDLEFDVDSLRIRDLSDDEDYQEFNKRKSTVFDQIKRGANTSAPEQPKEDPTEGDTVGKIRAQTDSTKLKQFLNNLGDS